MAAVSARKKKKRHTVRERDWEAKADDAFSHDRIRHRRARVNVSDAAPKLPPPETCEPNALVVAHAKKWAFVLLEGEERLCTIDERLVDTGSSLLAPGDRVLVEETPDEAVVRAIAPRRTRLSRPALEQEREQVIAANVDQLVVVAAVAMPPFRPGLVDRYLVAAQRGDVAPLLCINKMDLAEAPPDVAADYEQLGIPVRYTSCKTGAGIQELHDALRGKISVLAGHSGVGKSSLLNVLDPDLALHTREVGAGTQRGKHTTTAARMYEIDADTRIIDTPGVRALGLWGVSPEEVAHYFPEIAEYSAGCRFRNCTHIHEPECAVQAAVQEGAIPPFRFKSYLRIRSSLEEEATGRA